MKWAALLLAALSAAGLAALLVYRGPWSRPPRPDPPPAPFAELEEVIAREGWDRWEVHVPPDLPGPYRRLLGTFSIGANPEARATAAVRDRAGRVVAPVELRGRPDFAQMAVHLETPDGRVTSAVLRRVPQAQAQ